MGRVGRLTKRSFNFFHFEIYILIYKRKNVRTNILWVYILVKLGSCPNDFQNH